MARHKLQTPRKIGNSLDFALNFSFLYGQMMIFWIISSQDLQADWFLKEYEKEKSGRVRVAVRPKKLLEKWSFGGTGSSVGSFGYFANVYSAHEFSLRSSFGTPFNQYFSSRPTVVAIILEKLRCEKRVSHARFTPAKVTILLLGFAFTCPAQPWNSQITRDVTPRCIKRKVRRNTVYFLCFQPFNFQRIFFNFWFLALLRFWAIFVCW